MREIRKWTKACHECQRVKTTRHTITPMPKFPMADQFEHIHIDIVVLDNDNDFRYLLTFIDRVTRWIEVIPLKDITTKIIAHTIYKEWISLYGVPLQITSDRETQFTSSIFEELCNLLGTQHSIVGKRKSAVTNFILNHRNKNLRYSYISPSSEYGFKIFSVYCI